MNSLILFVSIGIILVDGGLAQSLCPPLRKPREKGKEMECSYRGQITDCSASAYPGTQAKYYCNKFYRSPQRSYQRPMKCKSDGRWAGVDDLFCQLQCGQTALNRVPLIAGGIETNPVLWPWHASLYQFNYETGSFSYFCGGTLIEPNLRTVLTAGHCAQAIELDRLENIRIVFGTSSSNFDTSKAQPQAQIHKVSKIIIHKNYNPTTFDSDIAILFLAKEVTLTDYVSPICLPDDKLSNLFLTSFGVSAGEVAGFGFHDRTMTVSEVMRYARLTLQSPAMCKNALNQILSTTQFCAGDTTGPAVCRGDSGSAMVSKDDEQYVIQGVVSFGDKSSLEKFGVCKNVAVFSKVVSYTNWILENIENSYDSDSNEGQYNYSPQPQRPKPSPPPPPSITTTASTTTTTTTQPSYSDSVPNLALRLHNNYRSQHSARPLELSQELSITAQAWSDYLLSGNLPLATKQGISYGQNLYQFEITGGTVTDKEVIKKAVDSWYSKRSLYQLSNPSHSSFTQLVWKKTDRLGVGISSKNGRTIVVCFYSPAGNLSGNNGQYYRENVTP